MPRKNVTHSEEWWLVEAPAHIERCEKHYKTGLPCRREALPGTVPPMCRQHGGAVPHVMAAAAVRIQNTTHRAVEVMDEIMENGEERNRMLAAKDFLDRAGYAPASKLMIGTVTDDPIERLFRAIAEDPHGLADPNAVYVPSEEVLALNRAADPQALLDEDVVDAEIVETTGPNKYGIWGHTDAETLEAIAKGQYRPNRMPRHIREAMEELL